MNIELVLTICIAVLALLTAITTYRLSLPQIADIPARRRRVLRVFYVELVLSLLLSVSLYVVSERQKQLDKQEDAALLSRHFESVNRALSALGLRLNPSDTTVRSISLVVIDTLKLQQYASTLASRQPAGGGVSLPPEAADSGINFPEELVETDLPASECKRYGINLNYCYGRFKLVNRFTEPILLYEASNGFVIERCSILISPGGTNMTPLLRAGSHDNGTCDPGAEEHKFYFRTTGGTAPKYGAISLTIHACKIRTKVISPRNFYLAPDGEKSTN